MKFLIAGLGGIVLLAVGIMLLLGILTLLYFIGGIMLSVVVGSSGAL